MLHSKSRHRVVLAMNWPLWMEDRGTMNLKHRRVVVQLQLMMNRYTLLHVIASYGGGLKKKEGDRGRGGGKGKRERARGRIPAPNQKGE